MFIWQSSLKTQRFLQIRSRKILKVKGGEWLQRNVFEIQQGRWKYTLSEIVTACISSSQIKIPERKRARRKEIPPLAKKLFIFDCGWGLEVIFLQWSTVSYTDALQGTLTYNISEFKENGRGDHVKLYRQRGGEKPGKSWSKRWRWTNKFHKILKEDIKLSLKTWAVFGAHSLWSSQSLVEEREEQMDQGHDGDTSNT